MRYPIEFYKNLNLCHEIFYILHSGVKKSKIDSISITEKKIICESGIRQDVRIGLSSGFVLDETDYICLSADDLKKELFAFQTETTG